jgi:hypothetical protein
MSLRGKKIEGERDKINQKAWELSWEKKMEIAQRSVVG